VFKNLYIKIQQNDVRFEKPLKESIRIADFMNFIGLHWCGSFFITDFFSTKKCSFCPLSHGFILDGCPFYIYAHIWNKSSISICWMHLIRSKESSNAKNNFGKGLFFVIRAQHVLSYHLVQVQWYVHTERDKN